MTEPNPTHAEVRAEGARNCGCGWEHFADGVVRFTRRCDDHQPMCRSLEDWEINLTPPGRRTRLAAETETP